MIRHRHWTNSREHGSHSHPGRQSDGVSDDRNNKFSHFLGSADSCSRRALLIVVAGFLWFAIRSYSGMPPLTTESSETLVETRLRYEDQCKNYTFANLISSLNEQEEDLQPPQKRKTLWVPSFPNSLDENLLRQWVLSFTHHMKAPVKAYYAQNRDFRRCQSDSSVTALCTIVHPMVVLRPPPEADKFTDRFAPSIIYIMRNPLTLFPAHHNAKAIRYHGHVGQVNETDWNSFRDEFVTKNLMDAWKTQIRTWTDSSYYRVALFFSFEHLMDPRLGPAELQRLQQAMETAGYPTRKNVNWPCVWYAGASVRAFSVHRNYDYTTNYVPAYTVEKRDMILGEMESFIREFHSDEGMNKANSTEHDQNRYEQTKKLVGILREYVKEIRESTNLINEKIKKGESMLHTAPGK